MSLLRPDINHVIEYNIQLQMNKKLYFGQTLLFATFYMKNGATVKYTAECFDFALRVHYEFFVFRMTCDMSSVLNRACVICSFLSCNFGG